jgi:pyruvate/2-oxoglutarate dehydrogenase complex dihydrolipoamide acyltransferase (E2) component
MAIAMFFSCSCEWQVMPNIDISVAVATQNGLITPIVKNVPTR